MASHSWCKISSQRKTRFFINLNIWLTVQDLLLNFIIPGKDYRLTVQTENGLSAQSKWKYKIIYYNTILHEDLFTGLREIDKYRKINPLVLLFQ